jgi:hypothetical protein
LPVFPTGTFCVARGTALFVFERDGLPGIFWQQFCRFRTAGLELTGGGEAQSLHFFGLQFAELTGFDIQDEGAVADAANLLDMMADLFEHFAQFAITALDDNDFVPGVVAFAHLSDAGGCGSNFIVLFGAAALDRDAFAQTVERLFGWLAGDFDEVGFFDAGGSFGELIGELAIVGDHEQAFAQVVEAANGVKALVFLREELHHSRTALGVSHGGDEAAGLVEHEVAQALGALKQFAIDTNVVAGRIGF